MVVICSLDECLLSFPKEINGTPEQNIQEVREDGLRDAAYSFLIGGIGGFLVKMDLFPIEDLHAGQLCIIISRRRRTKLCCMLNTHSCQQHIREYSQRFGGTLPTTSTFKVMPHMQKWLISMFLGIWARQILFLFMFLTAPYPFVLIGLHLLVFYHLFFMQAIIVLIYSIRLLFEEVLKNANYISETSIKHLDERMISKKVVQRCNEVLGNFIASVEERRNEEDVDALNV
ncbi:hypothetical protein ACJX0J_019477, partial [Zea mays]